MLVCKINMSSDTFAADDSVISEFDTFTELGIAPILVVSISLIVMTYAFAGSYLFTIVFAT